MVISIRRSQHEEGEELVAIWCRSVDATHDFLSAEYRAELEELVRSFLPEAPLWVAVNERDQPYWVYVVKWAAYGCAVYRS